LSFSYVYRPGRRAVSIELFPPKTAAGELALYSHVEKLLAYAPDFITCTYGAGGSTREKTLEIVDQIKRRFQLPVATHLTVVGSTMDQLREYLRDARGRGVDYVVALRGDPPQGQSRFLGTPGGLRHAAELVRLIRQEFPEFGVAVAGYPEKHQEAASFEIDTAHLKAKVDEGANVVITQLFYDNADFFRFRDRCDELGIQVPIVPGILPITNLSQIQRIASLCGSKIPGELAQRLAERDDPAWQLGVGVEHACRQVAELIEAGVPGLHFYVLNQSQAMLEIFEAIRSASAPPR
jgi:methylenetetrahydrofolate reductase (NADPH)